MEKGWGVLRSDGQMAPSIYLYLLVKFLTQSIKKMTLPEEKKEWIAASTMNVHSHWSFSSAAQTRQQPECVLQLHGSEETELPNQNAMSRHNRVHSGGENKRIYLFLRTWRVFRKLSFPGGKIVIRCSSVNERKNGKARGLRNNAEQTDHYNLQLYPNNCWENEF